MSWATNVGAIKSKLGWLLLGQDRTVKQALAIGAGIALSGMEVVNELGAVELLGHLQWMMNK